MRRLLELLGKLFELSPPGRAEGREYARSEMDKATDKAAMREHLEAMADGAFDFTDFDRGILDIVLDTQCTAPAAAALV